MAFTGQVDGRDSVLKQTSFGAEAIRTEVLNRGFSCSDLSVHKMTLCPTILHLLVVIIIIIVVVIFIVIIIVTINIIINKIMLFVIIIIITIIAIIVFSIVIGPYRH